MAIVTQPLGSIEARGSVGPWTYNTWRGRSYVKTRAGRTSPVTEKQQNVINLFVEFKRKWAYMTDEQRAAWERYAENHTLPDWTGEPKRITGINWYVKCNVILALTWELETAEPPQPHRPYRITNLVAANTYGDVIVTWENVDGLPYGTAVVDIWRSEGHSSARHPDVNETKRAMVKDASDEIAVLPDLEPDKYYTIFIRLVDDHGQTSTWYRAEAAPQT